jgi:hypothetical protein
MPWSTSRCQDCAYHVSPALASTLPIGCGIAVKSKVTDAVPLRPVVKSCCVRRPIDPERHRLPWLPPGCAVIPNARTDRKSKLAVDGRSSRLSGPIRGQHPPLGAGFCHSTGPHSRYAPTSLHPTPRIPAAPGEAA